MFQVPLAVDAGDESDGLRPRAEGPLDRDVDDVFLVVALGADAIGGLGVSQAEFGPAIEPFIGREASGEGVLRGGVKGECVC